MEIEDRTGAAPPPTKKVMPSCDYVPDYILPNDNTSYGFRIAELALRTKSARRIAITNVQVISWG